MGWAGFGARTGQLILWRVWSKCLVRDVQVTVYVFVANFTQRLFDGLVFKLAWVGCMASGKVVESELTSNSLSDVKTQLDETELIRSRRQTPLCTVHHDLINTGWIMLGKKQSQHIRVAPK